MGYSTSLFINHSLEFTNATELIASVEKITKQKVTITDNGSSNEIPQNEQNGLLYLQMDDKNIEDEYLERKHIILDYFNNGNLICEMWISKHAIELSFENIPFNFYRWGVLFNYFRQLSELPTNKLSEESFNDLRQLIYKWLEMFGGTYSIIFCYDTNEELVSELWEGANIEEALIKHGNELIIFKYPSFDNLHLKYDPYDNENEDHSIYNHFLLHDDYSDLKNK